MTLTWWMIALNWLGVIFAFFLGWRFAKTHHDGTIRIEVNEDGSRDVVRFILNLDLDDIRKHKSLVFKVEDLSQKSQRQ